MRALNQVRSLKAHFVGLANPTRLAILAELTEGELGGSELARRLKLSQPLLSWHLRVMRRAGLIATRRAGRELLCSLDRRAIRDYQERFNQFIGPGARGEDYDSPSTEPQTQEIANVI
jgi:DNA-binding transcriptional ArsR family regulator